MSSNKLCHIVRNGSTACLAQGDKFVGLGHLEIKNRVAYLIHSHKCIIRHVHPTFAQDFIFNRAPHIAGLGLMDAILRYQNWWLLYIWD